MAVRSRILWPCAAILGVAAGFNYARINLGATSAYQEQAKSHGFESGNDYLDIGKLLDNDDIRSLDNRQFGLLSKYANGPSFSPDYVAGILNNIHDDSLAMRTIPVAVSLRKRLPDRELVTDLPSAWAKNGCAGAARSLSQSPAWTRRDGSR